MHLIETGLQAKESERERFLALAGRFKESSDLAESDRLREEHVGSFKICGQGRLPRTFLLKGQPGKGQPL